MYELSVNACRQLDALAIEEFAIPSIVLMENAARSLCKHALEMLHPMTDRRVAIYCGPGNNGGDGLALARHLHNQQIDPIIHLLADPEQYAGDARSNLEIVKRMKLTICDPECLGLQDPMLIVDAIFGTGLSRPPSGHAAESIERINACREQGSRVLAVDVPSGLDAQTGEPMSPCVLADRTVTLAALKPGFAALHAQSALGYVVVEDIGAPRELLDRLGTPMRDHHPGMRKSS